MSDRDILKENARLQALVETLKRDNNLLKDTVQQGTMYTENLLQKYNELIVQAQAMIEAEHSKWCSGVGCKGHKVSAQQDETGAVELARVSAEEDPWGDN